MIESRTACSYPIIIHFSFYKATSSCQDNKYD